MRHAIFQAGVVEALERSLKKLEEAAAQLTETIGSVREEWWKQTGIDGNLVKEALANRRRRMRDIVKVDQWESLDDNIQGGYLL